MVNIKVDLLEFEVIMDGHAEAQRVGDADLVCCAASTIGQQLLYSLERWQDTHGGIVRIEKDMGDGYMRIKVRAEEWARPTVLSRYRYFLEGAEMLEEDYPKNIHVEVI